MEVRESFRFADYFAVCGVGKFLEPTDIRVTGNPLNIRYKGKSIYKYIFKYLKLMILFLLWFVNCA